jgi:hypothetical protein
MRKQQQTTCVPSSKIDSTYHIRSSQQLNERFEVDSELVVHLLGQPALGAALL